MQKRILGKGGLEVSALGLGCIGMSFGYGPAGDKNEMISVIRAAVEHGVTFSTRLKCTARLQTKNWWGKPSLPSVSKWRLLQSSGSTSTPVGNSRPEHIKEVADASLKRLKTDVIDLFYQHRVDPDVPANLSEIPAQSRFCFRFFSKRGLTD